MDDGEHTRVRERRMANTRMVVEAAIDFSNGSNREMWNTYRWRMSDNISPWRTGGFIVEEQATSEFATESPLPPIYGGLPGATEESGQDSGA